MWSGLRFPTQIQPNVQVMQGSALRLILCMPKLCVESCANSCANTVTLLGLASATLSAPIVSVNAKAGEICGNLPPMIAGV